MTANERRGGRAAVRAVTNLPGPGRRVLARASLVARLFEDDIVSGSKTTVLLRPRWAVMLVMHELGWSGKRIGHLLGGRDHSTVSHGVGRALDLLETDGDFRAMVDELRIAARDVTAFIAPLAPLPAIPPKSERKPDPDEFEEHTRRRRMAEGSLLLARAIREYRRAA